MEEVQSRNGLYGFEFRERDERRREERKTPEIKQMWQRSHEIVNLAAKGYKNIEIAEILNITPQTVSNTLNSELGERKLSDVRLGRDEEAKKVVEKVRVLTDRALKVYHDIFDCEDGEVNLKDKGHFAEGFIKEVSGLRAPVRIQSQSIHTVLTKEEIEQFKSRGLKAIGCDEEIIDIGSESEADRDQNQD